MDGGDEPKTAAQPGYLFTELTSLDELSFPASSSKRIKFTCISASPRHLVLGTSSGTVYVFSRFRPKGRGTSLPPVEVFTTKDGSVNKILVSPDEQNIAVGSDSGRVSVAALAANGLATAIIYTSPGDARRTDKVTGLCWSNDSKIIFASHMSGSVIAHQLTQSVFRASAKTIYTMDSEIVQLEMNENRKQLLVSSLTASFVYDLDSRTSSQVGKKTRNSRMGACFVQSEKEACEFIAASRPNGRLWEANNVGVVYRTHQFRLSSHVPRYSIASFRSSFKGSQRLGEPTEQLETAANEDVQLFQLQTIKIGSQTFLVSSYGSKLLVFDTESSQVILLTDLGKEILQFSVCSSDVFVILNTSSNSTAPAKLTLLPTEKAVEKLQLRSCHSQAAEIITKTSGIKWDPSLIKSLIEGLASKKKERNIEMLKSALGKLLSQMEFNESTYDNQIQTEVSKKLPSGVHRVLCQPTVSGLEDDFSFRFTSPLRERSQSSPTVDLRQSHSISLLMKQNSVPLTAEEVESCSRNGTPDVTEQDILERARTILESDGHVIEADSLRTLLQFESPDMRFTPQVTVANAAKALAELALVTPLDVSSILTVDRRINASGTKRTGPTIVKPVRRQVSRPAAAPPPLSPKTTSPMERNSNIIQEIASDSAEKILFSDEENNMDLGEEWLERRMSQIKKDENGEEKFQNSVPSTSSESESITTTESGRDMKLESGGEQPEDTDLCRHCGMHRSWLGLSILASVCKRVQVDSSTKKSVPSSIPAWSQLLTKRIKDSSLESQICPRCEAAFASVGKTLAQLPKSSGLTPKEHKIDTNGIRERIKETGSSRIETICSGSPSNSKLTSPDLLSPTLSADSTLSKNSISSSHCPAVFSPKSNSLSFEDNDLPWLNRIEVNTLLFFCCLVLGYRGLLSVLRESTELAELLDPSHWATLVSLAIRDQQFKRDFIGSQVVKEVLDSLRLSQFLSIPSADKSPTPRASISRRAAPPPMFCWIIDSTGSCLICTLPLQTQVKGEDLLVTSFQCSHTYHSKCLAGKSYCVACRVRARKLATVTSGPIRPAVLSAPRVKK